MMQRQAVAPLLVGLAGLMGVAGVGIAAAAAHAEAGAALEPAADMLLFHAAAVTGLAAVLDRGLVWKPLGTLAAFGLIVGTVLFAGDLAARAWFHSRLFPMAAPIGGTTMMLSWLMIAVAAAVRGIRGSP